MAGTDQGVFTNLNERRLKAAFWPKMGFLGRPNLDSAFLESPIFASKIVLLFILQNS